MTVCLVTDPTKDHPLLLPFLRQLHLEGRAWYSVRTAGRNFTGWLASGPQRGDGVTQVNVDLSQVTARDLEAYQRHCRRATVKNYRLVWTFKPVRKYMVMRSWKPGLVYNTVRGYCILIWDWLRDLYGDGEIPTDPTVGAPRLKRRRTKAVGRIFSEAEVDAFLAAVVKHSDNPLQDLAAFGCLSGLGLRSAELLGMSVSDVDTVTHRITVTRKGRHRQAIPIDGSVRKVLYQYLQCRLPAASDEPLWLLPGQRRLRYSRLLSRFRRFKALAGITGKANGPHTFRHYFITQQLLHGHPPELVARFVGHSSPRELEPYFHLSPLLLRNRLYEVLGFDVSKPFIVDGRWRWSA